MDASETGSQPVSRSAFVVSHHLDGLLLLDLLRIFIGVPVLGFVTFHTALRRTPRHVVLPFEALLPVCSGLGQMANHLSAGLTSPNGSPRQFTVSLAPSSLVFLRLDFTLPHSVIVPRPPATRKLVRHTLVSQTLSPYTRRQAATSQHNQDSVDPKMTPLHRAGRYSIIRPADHPPQSADRSLQTMSDNRPIRWQSDHRRVNRSRCVTTASLNLEAFLHTRSRDSEHVAMDPSSLLPWACPDSSRWILANPPLRLFQGASASANLRWPLYNRSG